MCAIMNGKPNGVYEQLVAYVYKYQKFNSTVEECPLTGTIDTIINMNNSSANAFPKEIDRLPGGDYKVVIRLHKKTNETFFVAEAKFMIKSKRGQSTTMLEMG